MTPPQFPAGEFQPEEVYGDERRRELIGQIEAAPANLRAAVAGLSETDLNTPYKNWTVRQIVHHIADSHVNAYIRFKLTLTEERPTIKPYDEGLWAALPDSSAGDITPTLALLDGLHRRWVALLGTLTAEQFGRAFYHPEYRETTTLSAALAQYAWHGRHHTGQILWLRDQRRLGM
ncbi:MAG: YfiT family bacillithiol transferase [Gemmataceae bacterium]